jgi:hypothetical protein
MPFPFLGKLYLYKFQAERRASGRIEVWHIQCRSPREVGLHGAESPFNPAAIRWAGETDALKLSSSSEGNDFFDAAIEEIVTGK